MKTSVHGISLQSIMLQTSTKSSGIRKSQKIYQVTEGGNSKDTTANLMNRCDGTNIFSYRNENISEIIMRDNMFLLTSSRQSNE